MNRLKCFLSGGHKYSDANLFTYTDIRKDVYVLCNYCLKCGKKYSVELDKRKLFDNTPYGREEIDVNGKEIDNERTD